MLQYSANPNGKITSDVKTFLKRSCRAIGSPCATCTVLTFCEILYPIFKSYNALSSL